MADDDRDPVPGMTHVRSDLAGPYRPADTKDVLQPIAPVNPVPPPGVRVSDADLGEEIRRCLALDGRLARANIAVTVHEGVVTVEGVTSTEFQRSLVTAKVNTVPGVLNVRNLLLVR